MLGSILWLRDRHTDRPLLAHNKVNSKQTRKQISMSRVVFEPTTECWSGSSRRLKSLRHSERQTPGLPDVILVTATSSETKIYCYTVYRLRTTKLCLALSCYINPHFGSYLGKLSFPLSLVLLHFFARREEQCENDVKENASLCTQ